jgi:hypothetical protein
VSTAVSREPVRPPGPTSEGERARAYALEVAVLRVCATVIAIASGAAVVWMDVYHDQAAGGRMAQGNDGLELALSIVCVLALATALAYKTNGRYDRWLRGASVDHHGERP